MDGHNVGDGFLAISMSKFQELGDEVDFVITLGDLPTHMLGYSPKKELYEQTVFRGLFESDTQQKPMFYVSGNNDSLAGNYQPFASEGKTPLDFADDWNGACVHCDGLIIDDSHMRTHGYYSTYVMQNNHDIILIVLNTTQWTNIPKFLPKYPNQDTDAGNQLHWLQAQLKANKAKQLLIAMHEPPGNDFKGNPIWNSTYLQNFISLLEQNQQAYNHITLLSSHTHMDEIRKIRLSSGKNVYVYATPSVSRVHYNNSAMKVFDVGVNMELTDFTTYYTTSTYKWDDDHYQALSVPDVIFPQCTNKNLDQCLDGLSDSDVCDAIEFGNFYGVKSKRVNNKGCRKTYLVN